jgi:hypothetical protein
MIFGVDTQANNASGSQTLVTLAGSAGGNSGQMPGQFTTLFSGDSYYESFFDTGSNGLFFSSSLTLCKSTSADPTLDEFYCPSSGVENFSATLQGQNGMSAPAAFSVAPADTLSGANTAFSNLAGTFPGGQDTHTFDWGLPFFYGKNVFTVIENATTSVGTGPYVAF